jgi:hypothetical protein
MPRPISFFPPRCTLSFPSPCCCFALPYSSKHRAAPRQAMPSTSHKAKRRRSCRLVLSFASSERALSSSCQVSKHQSAKLPFAFSLHVDSSPLAMIRCPSTSASSTPAPRCSLTQPLGASTTRSSHPLGFLSSLHPIFSIPILPLCSALLIEVLSRPSPSDAVDKPPSQAPPELPPRVRLCLL